MFLQFTLFVVSLNKDAAMGGEPRNIVVHWGLCFLDIYRSPVFPDTGAPADRCSTCSSSHALYWAALQCVPIVVFDLVESFGPVGRGCAGGGLTHLLWVGLIDVSPCFMAEVSPSNVYT